MRKLTIRISRSTTFGPLLVGLVLSIHFGFQFQWLWSITHNLFNIIICDFFLSSLLYYFFFQFQILLSHFFWSFSFFELVICWFCYFFKILFVTGFKTSSGFINIVFRFLYIISFHWRFLLFLFCILTFCIYFCVHFCMSVIFLIIFHKQFSGFFIEGTLRKWDNHQTFYNLYWYYWISTSNIFLRDHCRGSQSFFKVFTQISPFSETFGWNILVKK